MFDTKNYIYEEIKNKDDDYYMFPLLDNKTVSFLLKDQRIHGVLSPGMDSFLYFCDEMNGVQWRIEAYDQMIPVGPLFVLNEKGLEIVKNDSGYKFYHDEDIYTKAHEKIDRIDDLILTYGHLTDTEKQVWVLDQVIRIIHGENYDKWVEEYELPVMEDDEGRVLKYDWDTGVEPEMD